MKKIEDFGIHIPSVLLPKNVDLQTWSVIACDQYTQDSNYWNNVEKNVGKNPSTLNLILPEIYLSSPNKGEKITKIQNAMKNYLNDNIFQEERNCFIYLERKTAFNRTRKGFIALIDLETYEWKPFSKANIRATEATIIERIPPRMEIRKGAALELPHIMLLVNDKEDSLMNCAKNLCENKLPLYNGKLMQNGGEITGFALESQDEIEQITKVFNKIALENKKEDDSTFLFAVGDGNHSLATAKAVWDEHKKNLEQNNTPKNEIENSPIRFALIEIVNIYDKGLTFEPIHRVIFNAQNEELITFISKKIDGKITQINSSEELKNSVKNSSSDFGFTFVKNNEQKYFLLQTKIQELAVSKFQPILDDFLQNSSNIQIDYIHGENEVIELGKKNDTLGVLLPSIEKSSFFETINKTGPLPRKSFSMGEADEKRFYLECRKLF